MLKINGNKLSTAGISFALPENFYIDIDGMEDYSEDGLRLLSPEKDCYISFITTGIEYESPVASLLDIFVDEAIFGDKTFDMFSENETGYKWIEEPQMSMVNNLKCAYVKYETRRNSCYEIHFERLEGQKKQLEVWLVVPKKYNIELETVLNREVIKEFYKSFKIYD